MTIAQRSLMKPGSKRQRELPALGTWRQQNAAANGRFSVRSSGRENLCTQGMVSRALAGETR